MNEDPAPPPKRLCRSQDGRLITGVCAGIGRYTRIDAVVYRVAFALLVLTTGVGVILYIGAFLLMAAPDGGPSKIEQIGKRIFDGDTAMALLGAALTAAMTIGLIGSWGSGDALAVVVVFGLAMLVARSRGVDLVQVARTLPDRVKGSPLSAWKPPRPVARPAYLANGMIDLARLSGGTPPPEAEPQDTPPYPAGPYGSDPYVQESYATRSYAADPTAETPAQDVSPRRRSYLTALTLVAALATAGAIYAFGGRSGFDRIQIILAGALAVIAVGLLIGAWFGRDHKLITLGAIMSLALASTSIAGNPAVAHRTHHMAWQPAAVAQAEQSHRVLVGEGVVDLTKVPLSPGQRLRVNADVFLGVLAVKVPSNARVEVDGHAFVGDITVDRQVTSGPGARVRRVLEPEGIPDGQAPTISLRIRSKVGDMEVTRVPA